MVKAIQKAFTPSETELAVYAKYCNPHIKLPPEEKEIRIHPVRIKYPARRRLELCFGSVEESVCILHVEALLHLYRTFTEGIAQATTFLSVAGSAVGYPCNLEVSVGTSFSAVLALCNLLSSPSVVVRGGSMTGHAVLSLEEKVEISDRAILAFEEPIRKQQFECMGCARCSRVCPKGLVPSYLYRCARNNTFDACEYLMVNDCMECGCCSYICPSNVDLLSYIRKAKEYLRSQEKKDSGQGEPSEEEDGSGADHIK